ncbi:sce7726 family protein [Chryseobacterium indologenes]|uniref:sce7726 family protein n=1 Tax=Chryseobacterium indologenes TaxID=253 RepID=UPI00162446E6|nr:sce7726 family protein [Chryseobacterium indologenes]
MIRKKDYSVLVRSYNTLSYRNQLRDLVSAFFKTEKYNDLNKFELAKTINDAVFKYYEGESILKYKLAKEFRRKNYIAAFEVKAKSSRTDFLVINGDLKSFEVKSKIDTLSRLNKQVCDYGDVFEFNTVVIDKIHLRKVLEMVPDYYGVWYYEGSKKIIFRNAEYSPNLNSGEQLGLFTKKELTKAFRSSCRDEILSNFDSVSINSALKNTLKERYQERWTFVTENWDAILPIDLQFFFNTNVKPEIIYS